LEGDSLCFVKDNKGVKRGAGGVGIFEGGLWDCAKLVEEHVGEGG